ncbi:hypothetical protein DFJ63DRAFT_333420 [Scheffersomyces coipomensis]|uniref:uncharacterized protein n=1 Tax=Scheffersomyces coipomensis TaxID=1788519 RepID=UPI00315DACB5
MVLSSSKEIPSQSNINGIFVDGNKLSIKYGDGIIINGDGIRVISVTHEHDTYGWFVDCDENDKYTLSYNLDLQKYVISENVENDYSESNHIDTGLLNDDITINDISSLLNKKNSNIIPINSDVNLTIEDSTVEGEVEEEQFQLIITQLQLSFIFLHQFKYSQFESIWLQVLSQLGDIEIYQYMVHRNYTLKILDSLILQIKSGEKFSESVMNILDSKFTRESWSRQPSCCGRMKLNGLIFEKYQTFKSFIK